MTNILKKPLFGFLENEIVKQMKLLALNPPGNLVMNVEAMSGGTEGDKNKILDNLVLWIKLRYTNH